MSTYPLTRATAMVLLASMVRVATKAETNVIQRHLRYKAANKAKQWRAAIESDIQTSAQQVSLGGIRAERRVRQRLVDILTATVRDFDPFEGLEDVVTPATMMRLCICFLDDEERRALVHDLFKRRRDTIAHRLKVQPPLGRAIQTHGLFGLVASYLTNVELVHKLGRASRAWYLYITHNDLAIAGGIVGKHLEPRMEERWEWLKAHGLPRARLLDLRDLNSKQVERCLSHSAPTRVLLSYYHMGLLDVLQVLVQHRGIRFLCLASGWQVDNLLDLKMLTEPAAVAWLPTLDELELCSLTGSSVSYALRNLQRYPRVLRVRAKLYYNVIGSASPRIEQIYGGLWAKKQRGECPGLEFMYVHVDAENFDGKPPTPPKGVHLEIKYTYSSRGW